MSFDWQSLAVLLIVSGALFYVARRGLARLRSFRASRGSACATGCGKCGDEGTAPAPRPAAPLVQIGRTRRPAR